MKLQREEEEMSSDCSSGCQSGWTTYFEHSSSIEFFSGDNVDSIKENKYSHQHGKEQEHEREDDNEEEEEDLSMVSDASSGPPHLRDEEEEEEEEEAEQLRRRRLFSGFAPLAPSAIKGRGGGCFKKRRVIVGAQQSAAPALLVDTATSPLFCSPKSSFNNHGSNFHISQIKGGKKK